MHYPTFPHSHSSMATLIGGGDSDSSDTDSSSSSSSSSSGSNTDINASLIKSYGERSKEKCDSNKEGPKGSTKKNKELSIKIQNLIKLKRKEKKQKKKQKKHQKKKKPKLQKA